MILRELLSPDAKEEDTIQKRETCIHQWNVLHNEVYRSNDYHQSIKGMKTYFYCIFCGHQFCERWGECF